MKRDYETELLETKICDVTFFSSFMIKSKVVRPVSTEEKRK